MATPHHAHAAHPRQKGEKPWEQQNPRDAEDKPHQHLSAKQKASAKRHAKAAGRPYPNLVDNMREAAKSHGGPAASKKNTKR